MHLCAHSLSFPAFTHLLPCWHPALAFAEAQPCTDQRCISSLHPWPPYPPQIPGREPHKWFLSSPLSSRAVHPNLVPAIPAQRSKAFHPPQCLEHLLSHIFTQLCASPLPAKCCWVPIWEEQHLSSAACPGRGRHSMRVGFTCWHSRK